MRKKTLLICIIILGTLFLSIIEEYYNPTEDEFAVNRIQQHIEAMEQGANPELGITEIPDNHVVTSDFTSHLPLIVIDIGENVIPITKVFEIKELEDGTQETVIKHTGEDPYVQGSIYVIDNEEYENTLSDIPTESSLIKIRYRGNSSLNFEKKQFAIKLVNEDGSNRRMSMLSMTENNDWVLNGSMMDASLIRNYMAYNLGSVLFEYTTEAKYCEVLFKNGDNYTYQGVYLMMEQVEEGRDRVELTDYMPGDELVSYLLCRDRADETEIQLSTYASKNKLAYGRLSILYPSADVLDQYAIDYIEKDIDLIERVLYSDNLDTFSTWTDYMDKQSFVDYFLINEIFGNYDAGENSTYYYKDNAGLLHVGPLWDYDGAMDNYWLELNNPQQIIFHQQPWFDKLCQSEEYVKALQLRYKELNASIFSAENLSNYVEEVSAFLGNAALREWSRWDNVYGINSDLEEKVDQDGYMIDRKRAQYQGEVQRLKDFFTIKEKYIADGLKHLDENIVDTSTHKGVYWVALLILAFLCSVVLIRRRETFR